MKPENSALLALAELRNLESNRVESESMRRSAEAQARHLAAKEAERRAQEEAERIAREHEHALAVARAEAEARAREEQARLQEAEMRARVDQEARLRSEQLRLEAQMRMAERAAAPRWPWLVVPGLIAAVAVAGTLAWRSAAEAERDADEVALERQGREDQLAAIAAKLDALEDEQARLVHEREQLELQLEVATTAAERDALLAKQAELDAKIAANSGTKPATKPTGKKPTKPTKPTTKPDEPTKPGRPPIVIDDTTDPLAGLGGP